MSRGLRTRSGWAILSPTLLVALAVSLVLGQGGTGRDTPNTNSNKKPTTKNAPVKTTARPAKPTAELDRKLAELKRRRKALLATHTASAPEVKLLDKRISVLEKQKEDILEKKSPPPKVVAGDTSSRKPSPSPTPATLEADPALFPPDTRNLQYGDPKPKSTAEPATEKVFQGREVDQRAQIISKPAPVYTEEARKNLVGGKVVLKAVLASSGQVTDIRVITGLPNGLTEQAIAAARRLKFTPAMKDGHAVSQEIQIEYNFSPY